MAHKCGDNSRTMAGASRPRIGSSYICIKTEDEQSTVRPMMSLISPIVEHVLQNKVGYIAPFLLIGGGMGYMEYQINGLDAGLKSFQSQYTEDALIEAYTDLCMNPGNSWLLDRISDLQEQYRLTTGERFDPPPCNLLVR